MVTEAFELIDRFEKSVDANGYRTRDRHTEEEYLAAKSALEAALSAAEPQSAPPLAAKALQAAIEELDRISCVPFVTETRNTYAQLELAKAYADRGSMAAQKALSALSAQVQDVAGSVPEEVREAATEVITAHECGMLRQTTWWENAAFLLAEYAMSSGDYAAAPAKQEG